MQNSKPLWDKEAIDNVANQLAQLWCDRPEAVDKCADDIYLKIVSICGDMQQRITELEADNNALRGACGELLKHMNRWIYYDSQIHVAIDRATALLEARKEGER